MKNEEIIRKRSELKAYYQQISNEWKMYDQEYPVIPGAYKPADYDYQQRRFLERLREVSNEIGKLPKTTGEIIRLVLIWLIVVGGITGILVLVL